MIACRAGEGLIALVISNLPAFPPAEGFSPKIDGLFPLATPCIADPCPDTFPLVKTKRAWSGLFEFVISNLPAFPALVGFCP